MIKNSILFIALLGLSQIGIAMNQDDKQKNASNPYVSWDVIQAIINAEYQRESNESRHDKKAQDNQTKKLISKNSNS